MMAFLPLFGHQSPLHEDLLASAHRFIEQERKEHYGVAVVLAQTACEVFTEQVRAQLIQKRQLSAELGEWIVRQTRDVDDRLDLYVALTADRLKQEAFWPEYRRHVDTRNDVVHRGRRVSKDDAAQSCQIVETMIRRMERIVGQLA